MSAYADRQGFMTLRMRIIITSIENENHYHCDFA